jgi:hypothetical protein
VPIQKWWISLEFKAAELSKPQAYLRYSEDSDESADAEIE